MRSTMIQLTDGLAVLLVSRIVGFYWLRFITDFAAKLQWCASSRPLLQSITSAYALHIAQAYTTLFFSV